MEKPKYVELAGKSFVILEREEYERLVGLEKLAGLPPLPEPNERGNFPAAEYLRASIARSLVRDRVELGLNQRELAELAGVRVETLCRIETGKHTASTVTIEKLDRALAGARKEATKANGRPRAKRRKRAS